MSDEREESGMAPQKPSLREQGKEDRRQRIWQAARALFRQQGFAATTTREIAAQAGVAVGTLFSYAKSKEDLLIQIFRSEIIKHQDILFSEEKARYLQSKDDPSSEKITISDRIVFIFHRLLDFFAADPELAVVFVKEMPFIKHEIAQSRELEMDFIQKVAAILEEAQESGEIAGEIPTMGAALNFFSLYYAALLDLFSNPHAELSITKQYLAFSFGLFFSGLSPR